MINSWIGRMLLVPLAIGTAGGCDSTPARARAAADPVPLAAPPELAGARLLYQRPDGIYLRVLGQAQATRLAADGTWPRWSPDGKSFAFVRGPRILHCDLETRKERVLAEASHARAVAFHPDGQRVLFTDGKSVKSVPVAGGSATTLVTGPAFLELDVSSTGDFLVTTVKSRGYRVWRFDLPAGRKTEIGRAAPPAFPRRPAGDRESRWARPVGFAGQPDGGGARPRAGASRVAARQSAMVQSPGMDHDGPRRAAARYPCATGGGWPGLAADGRRGCRPPGSFRGLAPGGQGTTGASFQSCSRA